MMRAILIAAIAGVAIGCAQTPPEAPPPLAERSAVAEGRQLAEIHCARCHAIGAEGESTHAMAPPFRSLSQNYPVTALEEAFAEGVLVGHPDMPEFQFEPLQVDSMIAYLQSVQEGGSE
jgi:mono/diheme cytochrome c family protein